MVLGMNIPRSGKDFPDRQINMLLLDYALLTVAKSLWKTSIPSLFWSRKIFPCCIFPYLEITDFIWNRISFYQRPSYKISNTNFVKTVEQHQHRKIACLEEIAYLNGWISKEDVMEVYEVLKKNQYGQYLKDVLDGKYQENLY